MCSVTSDPCSREMYFISTDCDTTGTDTSVCLCVRLKRAPCKSESREGQGKKMEGGSVATFFHVCRKKTSVRCMSCSQ